MSPGSLTFLSLFFPFLLLLFHVIIIPGDLYIQTHAHIEALATGQVKAVLPGTEEIKVQVEVEEVNPDEC